METLARHWPGHYFGSAKECLQVVGSMTYSSAPETIEHVLDAQQFLAKLDMLPFTRADLDGPLCLRLGCIGAFSNRDASRSSGPYGWLLEPGSR